VFEKWLEQKVCGDSVIKFTKTNISTNGHNFFAQHPTLFRQL